MEAPPLLSALSNDTLSAEALETYSAINFHIPSRDHQDFKKFSQLTQRNISHIQHLSVAWCGKRSSTWDRQPVLGASHSLAFHEQLRLCTKLQVVVFEVPLIWHYEFKRWLSHEIRCTDDDLYKRHLEGYVVRYGLKRRSPSWL
ncbi:hypothetical protein EG329_002356 [Mollisiaceae sp. DMI_Dod_QoI]|nr:hypothetical protein EG329_002356 [Helotiales sp. DMI_Dod_QoI]